MFQSQQVAGVQAVTGMSFLRYFKEFPRKEIRNAASLFACILLVRILPTVIYLFFLTAPLMFCEFPIHNYLQMQTIHIEKKKKNPEVHVA